MERRTFIKMAGISAAAISSSGFTLIKTEEGFSTDCSTSTDMLGPFFREGAPERQIIPPFDGSDEVPLKVVGTIYGADCKSIISEAEIDIWHCDHQKVYDMDSAEFRCRAKLHSDEHGQYWFQTYVPPPYGGRPKHIHYLIHGDSRYDALVTQLYFRGDKRIKPNNWIKYPWDEKRILEVYTNEEGMAEVRLDLYLRKKTS